jgi:hypothetical protein
MTNLQERQASSLRDEALDKEGGSDGDQKGARQVGCIAGFSWQSIECSILLNALFVGVFAESEFFTDYQYLAP